MEAELTAVMLVPSLKVVQRSMVSFCSSGEQLDPLWELSQEEEFINLDEDELSLVCNILYSFFVSSKNFFFESELLSV